MRVLKFGGTSLANPERFSQAAQLIEKAHLEEQAAGVLSAPAKITNHLVALSEKAALNQPTDTHFNEAVEIFYNIINGLHAENNKFDLAGTKALIDAEFAQIKGLLEEIRQAGKVEDKVKATIDCRGEKLSIAMMKAWFEARGYSVHIIDPVKQLLAQGGYLESSVDIEESTKRVDAKSIGKDKVVLMAGFTACNQPQTNSKSETSNAPIKLETPQRAQGQTDVLNLTTNKLDTVRVGIIGLGMRGYSAVERYMHIEGAKITALCDIRPEMVEKAQQVIEKAGRSRVPQYTGSEDAWKALCERPDVDLVYIVTDWKHHTPMALYAMQHGKHVAIEVPAALDMDEIWALIDTSEKTRRHCSRCFA